MDKPPLIYPSEIYEFLEITKLKSNINFIDKIIPYVKADYVTDNYLEFINSRIINIVESTDITSIVTKQQVDNNVYWNPGGINGSIQYANIIKFEGSSDFKYLNNELEVKYINSKYINVNNILFDNILKLTSNQNILSNSYDLIFPSNIGLNNDVLMLKNIDWISYNIPITCNNILYNNNKLIASGSSGIIYSNNNGVSFNVLNNNNIIDMTYNNEIYVGISTNYITIITNTLIVTSVNIITSDWKCIKWCLYQFIAISSNYIMISNDAIIWTTYIYNNSIKKILYSDIYNRYISISNNNIYESLNGLDWSIIYNSLITLNDIIETDKIVLIGSLNKCIYTNDLIEWITNYVDPINNSINWKCITYINDEYLVDGYKSKDLITWITTYPINSINNVFNFTHDSIYIYGIYSECKKYTNDLRLIFTTNPILPGGLNNSLQYNDNGVFNGAFDYTSNILSGDIISSIKTNVKVVNTINLILDKLNITTNLINDFNIIFPINVINSSCGIFTDGIENLFFNTLSLIPKGVNYGIIYNNLSEIYSTTYLIYDGNTIYNTGIHQYNTFINYVTSTTIIGNYIYIFNDYIYFSGSNLVNIFNIKNNLSYVTTNIIGTGPMRSIIYINNLYYILNGNKLIHNNNILTFSLSLNKILVSGQYIYIKEAVKFHIISNYTTLSFLNFPNNIQIQYDNNYFYVSSANLLYTVNIDNPIVPYTINKLTFTNIITDFNINLSYLYISSDNILYKINKYNYITVYTKNMLMSVSNIFIENNILYSSFNNNIYIINNLTFITMAMYNNIDFLVQIDISGNNLYILSGNSLINQVDLNGMNAPCANIGYLNIADVDISGYLNVNCPMYVNNIISDNNINLKNMTLNKINGYITTYTSITLNKYASNIYMTNSEIVGSNMINYITVINYNVTQNSIIKTSIIDYEHGFPITYINSIKNGEFIISLVNVSLDNIYGKIGISYIIF